MNTPERPRRPRYVVRDVIRTRRCSPRTEKTYWYRMRYFVRFHNMSHPRGLAGLKVSEVLQSIVMIRLRRDEETTPLHHERALPPFRPTRYVLQDHRRPPPSRWLPRSARSPHRAPPIGCTSTRALRPCLFPEGRARTLKTLGAQQYQEAPGAYLRRAGPRPDPWPPVPRRPARPDSPEHRLRACHRAVDLAGVIAAVAMCLYLFA
ncbi:phage integrase N-terminal SAM-like domain-containing protein [Aquisalimonas lutea]|uniref:phage integrase N-terminal SAM-like domain-containing protein n=1 Tax=Aquisalimonas lutea TaxID=1327750 RepID=UPI003F4937D1